MRIFLSCIFVVIMFSLCGCFGVFKDVQTRVDREEMTHLSTVQTSTNTSIEKIAKMMIVKEGQKGLDKKTAYALAKLIYKTGQAASDIQPSEAGNLAQQWLLMFGREKSMEQMKVAGDWGIKQIGSLAGASTGLGGLGIFTALLGRRNKKNKAESAERIDYEVGKNRLKTSLINTDPNMVAKVNEAAKHTVMEGNIL
jgi:hypothetical protein